MKNIYGATLLLDNKREYWVDVCKAILIYLMVLGHCGFVEYNKWFYAFHMPCFFIISGYLYKPRPISIIAKRLFVPVVFFSVINICYQILIRYLSSNVDVLALLKDGCVSYFMYGPDVSFFPGVWFICVLFFCRCLMGDLPWFRKYGGRNDWYVVIACILVTMVLPKISSGYDKAQNIYIIKTIACLPFMLIGRQLQQNKDKFKVTIPIILFFIVVGISLTMFNGGIDIYSSVYGKSTAVMYINAIVSSLALCAICQKITFHRIYVIELLSKGTLLILGVHIMCLSILKFLLNKIGVEYTFVLGLMCAFIVLLVCIPIIHIADCKFKWIIGK